MAEVKQIDVEEVYEIFNKKNDDYVLIDIREPDEWEQGTIPNIKKISMGELPNHFSEMDKNKKYIMVCRSGARSNRMSAFMLEQGFSDVSNFQGGMLSWYDEDYPLE
ncbi:MAG: rhodanese-like domain-containing protein [Candidatus Sericytochromatia bacterium]